MDTRATDCFPGQLRSGNRCPGGVVKDESASDGAYVAGARSGHNALGDRVRVAFGGMETVSRHIEAGRNDRDSKGRAVRRFCFQSFQELAHAKDGPSYVGWRLPRLITSLVEDRARRNRRKAAANLNPSASPTARTARPGQRRPPTESSPPRRCA
jgi:hypothetical protein